MTSAQIRLIGQNADFNNLQHYDLLLQPISILVLKANCEVVQAYSMDCYFRQYWRDERLSFKACFSILAITSVYRQLYFSSRD